MSDGIINLSTDMAIAMGKSFFKTMGQKLENTLGVSLLDEEQVRAYAAKTLNP